MDQSTRRAAYKLRFEEFGDLRVRMRAPSFRGLKLLRRAVAVLGDDLGGEHLDGEARLDGWDLLFAAFTDALLDWDLTDRGRPVPATWEGVQGQDVDLLLPLVAAWYRRVVLRPQPAAVAVGEPAPRPAREPVPSGPSAEELALLAIPFEVGNDAATEAAEAAEAAEVLA